MRDMNASWTPVLETKQCSTILVFRNARTISQRSARWLEGWRGGLAKPIRNGYVAFARHAGRWPALQRDWRLFIHLSTVLAEGFNARGDWRVRLTTGDRANE